MIPWRSANFMLVQNARRACGCVYAGPRATPACGRSLSGVVCRSTSGLLARRRHWQTNFKVKLEVCWKVRDTRDRQTTVHNRTSPSFQCSYCLTSEQWRSSLPKMLVQRSSSAAPALILLTKQGLRRSYRPRFLPLHLLRRFRLSP